MLVALVEEPLARPGGDGVHEQAQLVEQPGGEELAHHGYRAGDQYPAQRLVGAQGGDRVGELAVDQLGVAPRELEG